MRPLNTKWKSTPGNFDPNHLANEMWSDNEWGIPEVKGTGVPVSVSWSLTFDAYRTKVRRGQALPKGLGVVSFFTEDYRFEQLWTSPERFLTYMTPEHWALTPDFSLYTDHPPAVHLWNIFRSRWLGAYWQGEGLRVLPTVSWASEDSFKYCFSGLPERAVLAVSTVGCLVRKDARRLWMLGFQEMLTRLSPIQVLCYGNTPEELKTDVPVTVLTPFQAKFVP